MRPFLGTCLFPPALLAGGLLVSLAACGSEGDRLRLPGLDDGDHLRGEQRIAFEVEEGLAVAAAELYLDDERIAFAPLRPFALTWDTRLSAEKRHQLRVRVRLDDDSFLDAEREVVVDNSPPILLEVPGYYAVPGSRLQLHAEDNFGVDVLLVTSDAWSEPVELKAPSKILPWPGGCGELVMTVQAYDKAGNHAARTYPVSASVPDDFDCDGHRSQAAGGGDCDDQASWVHPGAAEPPEGHDLNCDGAVSYLDGVDRDGDGVPSISDGGSDCDDLDAAVHGEHLRLNRYPLTRDGLPVRWQRGEAVLGDSSSVPLYLNHAGTIEEWFPASNRTAPSAILTTGATPGSIAADRYAEVIAFGRGNSVELMRREANRWTLHSTISTDQPVGKLQLLRDGEGLSVVYQAGTEVWLAKRQANGAWTLRLVRDAGAPLVEIASFRAGALGIFIAFRTSTTTWLATQASNGTGLDTRALSTPNAIPMTLAADPDQLQVVVAARGGSGSSLFIDGFSAEASRRHAFPERITGVFLELPRLLIQLQSGELQVMSYSPHTDVLRVGQRIPALDALDTFSFRAFAGDGVVYARSNLSISAALDPYDGLDRDCDGFDH